MSNAGIGTPYWYEWEIGIIECLHMMTDQSIESVTLQSRDFQSLDDVVIKYVDSSIVNIQVKHTDVNDTLTYSDLESDNMIKSWAREWNEVKSDYLIKSLRIVTNRKWGPNATNGKCSFAWFISIVLPKLKSDLSYWGENEEERKAIEWFRKTINLNEEGTNEFIKIIEFINQSDLCGLETQIKELLSKILGTDKSEVIGTAIDRLRSNLEKWATSRRNKSEITREDIYKVLCQPKDRLPEFELYPQKPIFPSRVEFAKQFINTIIESNKKVIFLQGLPGAGKTNFISYLALLKNTIVDFRYYTYLPVNPNSPSFSDDEGYYNGKQLWSSILYQIKRKFEELNLLNELEFPLIYDYLSVTELRSAALKFLPIYAQKCGRICYLFIDGMDHAARFNKGSNTFLSQLPKPDEIGDGIKFIYVGQPLNDIYPKWLTENPSIDYCELPLLEKQDIKTIIDTNNIVIDNVDIDTLSSSIIDVIGNNTLNVLFAVLEIKKMPTDSSYDEIIYTINNHGLNNYIDRYYEWILSSITTEYELLLLKIEAIYAFSSRKIPVGKLKLLCETDIIILESVLHKLYPIIVSDEYGYYVFHNDVKLFLKTVIRSNSNFKNIVASITSSILKYDLEEFKYDILFNLNIESKDIKRIFDFYDPNYIVGSLKYQISIDRLLDQFNSVVELFVKNNDLQLIHNLSLVSTSISKLIECVNYYEKDKQFIESKMANALTRSEKYILNIPEDTVIIIDDIYNLIKADEIKRAEKIYDEYFPKSELISLLSDDDAHSKDFEKAGVICRFFNTEAICDLDIENCYASFVTGWLEASVHFCSEIDIKQTFSFKMYAVSSLHKYVSEILLSPDISNESITCLSEILCRSEQLSLHTLTEVCFHMLLKGIPCEKIQDTINTKVNGISYFEPLTSMSTDYKYHGVLGFFKTYFCLYNHDTSINWEELYELTLKNKHISVSDRGYDPAMELKLLSEKIYQLFYNSKDSNSTIVEIAYTLVYFAKNRGGSCEDCGAFEVLKYFKNVFLQTFINDPDCCDKTKLCKQLMPIFAETDPRYVDELAQLFYLFDNKSDYLKIANFWCGENGIVWQKEYDDLENICKIIISLLNKFGESELADKIQGLMNQKILGYVGNKDYTIKGLLDCYTHLPTKNEIITKYGMELLTISEYANCLGDNRTDVYDDLFDAAGKLGIQFLDALFELKNTPNDLLFWRQRLLTFFYNNLDDFFHDDKELIMLYKLTNSWINIEIENSVYYRNINNLSCLFEYNYKIIESLSDETSKEELKAKGNYSPASNDTDDKNEAIKTHSEEYVYLLEMLKTNGYTPEFENEISRAVNLDKDRIYYLIIDVLKLLSEENKRDFTIKCVIPYLHQDSKYGYRMNGMRQIIELTYFYFRNTDWIELFNDVSKRISIAKNNLDLFYYIYEDIEFLSLLYYIQNHSDRIEQMFMDRCKMHYTFISSAGALIINHQHLCIDKKINSFIAFVNKQLGDRIQ